MRKYLCVKRIKLVGIDLNHHLGNNNHNVIRIDYYELKCFTTCTRTLSIDRANIQRVDSNITWNFACISKTECGKRRLCD